MFRVKLVEQEKRHLFEGFLTPVASEIDDEELLVIGLADGSLAVGALAGQIMNDAFYILSIYVAPDYRRRGGGSLLMEALAEVVTGMGVSIRTEVLDISKESKSAIAFFEYIGFKRDLSDYTGIYLANIDDLLKDDILSGAVDKRVMEGVYSMKDVDKAILSRAEKQARAAGAPLPDSGMMGANVDRNISAVHVKGSEIDGYAIMDNSICGYPTLSSLWSAGATKNLAGLFRMVADKAKKTFPAGTKIAFFPVNDVSVGILKKIAPDAENITYRFTLFE